MAVFVPATIATTELVQKEIVMKTSEHAAQSSSGGRYLTRHEAAKYLRVCLKTLDVLLAEKRVPIIRPTRGRVLLDINDLDSYLESTKQSAAM